MLELLAGSRPVLAALLAALLTGCATRGGMDVVERLDQATGLTLVSAREPLVFARGEPGYSRSARDYLYVGPVETDKQGVREYYLWVGVGTTLDRGYLAPGGDEPRILLLRVRGEWMELDLKPLGERIAGSSAGHLYRTAVKTPVKLAARVTLNQLELMDSNALQSIRVVDVSGRTSRYVRWKGTPAWTGFIENAGGKTVDTAASPGGAVRGSASSRAGRGASNSP